MNISSIHVPAPNPSAPLLPENKMCATLTIEPPADFSDPRVDPHFQSEHWPLCNGEPSAPPDTPGLHERRCLEFLAAFYRLNVLNGRLLAARTAGAPDEVIRLVLSESNAAIKELEKLEDRYAPIGFFGEPVMDGIRYQNVIFVRPELPRIYGTASMLSSCFAVPGIEEIPESELRGPARIIRLGYGKMDI
jgi:hypothetical protein